MAEPRERLDKLFGVDKQRSRLNALLGIEDEETPERKSRLDTLFADSVDKPQDQASILNQLGIAPDPVPPGGTATGDPLERRVSPGLPRVTAPTGRFDPGIIPSESVEEPFLQDPTRIAPSPEATVGGNRILGPDESPNILRKDFGSERELARAQRGITTAVEGLTFGLPKLFGSAQIKERLLPGGELSPTERFVEESIGLATGLKAISGAVGLVKKAFGQVGRVSPFFTRLAEGFASGKFAPRLAHAVQLGIATGAADVVNQVSGILGDAPENQEGFSPTQTAVSIAHGAALGSLLVPTAKGTFSGIPGLRKLSEKLPGLFGGQLQGKLAFSRLSLGARGAALGLPLVALTGDSTSPARPTGNPYIDQLLFDFGLFAVLGGGKARPGMKLPAWINRAGQKSLEPVTLMRTQLDNTGRRTFTIRTDDGLIRDYRPGDPQGGVNADIPEGVREMKARRISEGKILADRPAIIKEGDLVAQVRGKTRRLVQFLERSKDGKSMRVGIVARRGELPVVHDIVTLERGKAGELLVLDKKGLEEMLPTANRAKINRLEGLLGKLTAKPELEDRAADLVSAEPPLLRSFVGAVNDLNINGIKIPVTVTTGQSKLGVQQVKSALSVLPAEALANVTRVHISDQLPDNTFGRFNKNTGAVTVNAGRLPRTTTNINTLRIPGFDMLIKTLAHEGQHSLATANPKGYERDIRSLGWVPEAEFIERNRVASAKDEAFPNDSVPNNVFDARRRTFLTASGETINAISSFDIGPLGGKWIRSVLPEEAKNGRIRFDRRSPVEDLAHGFDQMLIDPDAVFVREPERFRAINDSLTATPYSIAGLTVEGSLPFGKSFAGQTSLFGSSGPRPEPGGERLFVAKQRIAVENERRSQVQRANQAIENLLGEVRPKTVGLEDATPPESSIDRVRKITFTTLEDPKTPEKTKKLLTRLITPGKVTDEKGNVSQTGTPPIDRLVESVARKSFKGINLELGVEGTGETLGSFVRETALAEAARTGKITNARIKGIIADLQFKVFGGVTPEGQSITAVNKKGETVDLADFVEAGTGEGTAIAGTPTVVPAPLAAAPRTRGPRSKPFKLFKDFIGNPDPAAQAQLVEEMASLNKLQRDILQLHLGIDEHGRSTAGVDFVDLAEVGARFNMTETEVGAQFRGFIRRRTGKLERVFGGKKGTDPKSVDFGDPQGPKQLILRTLPAGASTKGGVARGPQEDLLAGKAFGEHFNNMRRKTLGQLTQAREQLGNRLVRNPKNKTLQRQFRAALTRENELASAVKDVDAQLAIDPDPAQGQLKLADRLIGGSEPPAKAVNRRLQGVGDPLLLERFRKARLSQLKNPEATKNNETVAQLSAELNRRGIEYPDITFPSLGTGGTGSKKPPKQASPTGPPGGGNKPTAPNSKATDFVFEITPDTTLAGQNLATKFGDLRPRLVTIRDRQSAEIIGTFRSHALHPDYDPVRTNVRFGIEPVGIVNEAAEPSTAKDGGLLRFQVTDLRDGSDLGLFTRSGVLQILKTDYTPGNSYNILTGEATPSGSDVAGATRNDLRSKMWRESLDNTEFAALEGPEQMRHISEMIGKLKPTKGITAWKLWGELTNQAKGYAGAINDYATLQGEMAKKFGLPDRLKVTGGDVLEAIERLKEFRKTELGAMLSETADFFPTSAKGTGKAFSAERSREIEAFKAALEDLRFNPKLSTDDTVMDPTSGQVAWGGGPGGVQRLQSVVRRMVFWSHPVMLDAYTKGRGIQAMETELLKNWNNALAPVFADLSPQEQIAVRLIREGRLDEVLADPARKVARRSLIDDSSAFSETRKLLQNMSTIMRGGKPATTELLLPTREQNPARFAELERRAAMLADLHDSVADLAHLPPSARTEDYFPKLYTKNALGNLEIPTDMNPGREVFFGNFQKRKTETLDFEIAPLQSMDIYLRGAARKIAWDPFLAEFNRPEVFQALGNEQAAWFKRWMRYSVGEPDPMDTVLSRKLRDLGIQTSGRGAFGEGLSRWIRRLAVSDSRPFTRTANAIRGAVFAAKIEFSAITNAINATQGPFTTSARFGSFKAGGIDGYLKAAREISSNPEIEKLFNASGLADQTLRSDIGIQAQRQIKGFLIRWRTLGRRSFTGIENRNRKLAFAAMNKTAREAGIDENMSLVAGILESDLTQFNMTRTGRLPLVRSGLGSVLFQFSPYRIEMLQLLGGEVRNMFLSPDKAARFKSFKFVSLYMMVTHMVGGVDANITGPFLRMLLGEDEPEFSGKGLVGGAVAAVDRLSADYLIGKGVQGKPFELGHRINPISLMMNLEITGPAFGVAVDIVNKIRGAPVTPSTAQLVVDNIPFGVQIHRSAGREIMRHVTRPLFGKKEGSLPRGGRGIIERIGGKKAKKRGFFTLG